MPFGFGCGPVPRFLKSRSVPPALLRGRMSYCPEGCGGRKRTREMNQCHALLLPAGKVGHSICSLARSTMRASTPSSVSLPEPVLVAALPLAHSVLSGISGAHDLPPTHLPKAASHPPVRPPTCVAALSVCPSVCLSVCLLFELPKVKRWTHNLGGKSGDTSLADDGEVAQKENSAVNRGRRGNDIEK